jgi:NAD(P)-dependent dehydrogenase (short-subunit alcohol dehydrogenase family)
MTKRESKIVLITGASSGIGRACAAHLADLGHRVYGTSRRPAQDGLPFTMLQMDVTDDTSVQQAIQTILDEQGRIDVVVNNAGIGYGGSVEDTSIEQAHATLETNCFGALRVCHAVLPSMRAQGSGTIINVGSIGGLIGLPYQGLYSASKYALEGMSEALRMEVKRFGVNVVLLEPGDICTEFTANRLSTRSVKEGSVYHEAYARALERIESDERNGAKPKVVARTVSRIVASPSPKLRYFAGPFYEKLAVIVKRLLPAGLFERIVMLNYGLK